MNDEEMMEATEGQEAEQAAPQGIGAAAQSIKVPPELQEAYQKVVVAGMKVMFDEQTHEMALRAMQGDGPLEERLASAIASLMGTLVEQSNKTMPPQVIIPAGIELLVAAADFLKKSEAEPVTNEQIGEAISRFVEIVLEQSGVVDPAKMQAMLQGGLAGEEQAPPAPAAGGLVNQAAEA